MQDESKKKKKEKKISSSRVIVFVKCIPNCKYTYQNQCVSQGQLSQTTSEIVNLV